MRKIDLTTWGHRSVVVIGVAGCVALTIGAYFAAIRPLVRQQSGLASQQAQLASQRHQMSELAETMATLTGRVRDVKQALGKTPLQLKPADEVTWHLARLADFASESGLEMGEAQLGESSDVARYKMVPIHLAGKGAYSACAVFLHQLSRKFSDTAVSSMEMSCDPENPGSVTDLQINLVWYAAPASHFARGS